MTDRRDTADAPQPRRAMASWLGETNDVTSTFLAAGRIPGLINLAGGLPAPELFPAEEIAEIAQKAITAHPVETLGYGPINGMPELRDALAEQFSSQSLKLARENVLITTSGMQALDLIGKVLLEPGNSSADLVACQFPAYLGALDAWRPRSPRYRTMDLSSADFSAGMSLEGVQFAYTVPNFSNPTGKLVDEPTRRALVDAAHRFGTWLVEDDPYGTLLYDGEPLPTMLELSGRKRPGEVYDGPVVYMGSLSKALVPGLRLGWIIAAPDMIEAMNLAKQGSDMCTSGAVQHIALGALKAGLIEKGRPKAVSLYRARRDALCSAMEVHLSGWFEWEVPVGGMFVWAQAKDPAFDTDALLPFAMEAGVCVSPSSVFDAMGAYRRAIRINFTLNEPEKLAEGVRRLAEAVRRMTAAT